jgi:hypothetical protein
MEGPRIVVVNYIYAAFYGQQAVRIGAFLNNVKYLWYLSVFLNRSFFGVLMSLLLWVVSFEDISGIYSKGNYRS